MTEIKMVENKTGLLPRFNKKLKTKEKENLTNQKEVIKMTSFELIIGGFDNLWVLLSKDICFGNVVDTLMHHFDLWNYEIINAELNPIEGAWLIKARVAFPAHIREEIEKHFRQKGAEIARLSEIRLS